MQMIILSPQSLKTKITLREKCPSTEFFLVRNFLYSGRIQENADQKKICIWTLLTQCDLMSILRQELELVVNWSKGNN